MTRASIGGHEYSGRSLGSIVRREYGRRAGVKLSYPGAPEVGLVIEQVAAGGAYNVLSVVHWLEGDVGDVEPARRKGVRW